MNQIHIIIIILAFIQKPGNIYLKSSSSEPKRTQLEPIH